MQVLPFLHSCLTTALPTIHARRLKAFMVAVHALLTGGVLALSALGRALSSPARAKHAIKRIDRLLSNSHLHAERLLMYHWLTQLLVGQQARPIILVDWSHLDAAGTRFLLRAAIPIGGRAVPIYEKVHDKEGCPDAHKRLLRVLAKMLPVQSTPILVTDAGFRRPWFQAVEAHGWFYVGRLRNREKIRLDTGEWTDAKALYEKASKTPESLGAIQLSASHQYETQLYRLRGEPKGRKHLNATGKPARSRLSRDCARREREPWLLLSNLPETDSNAANRITRLYGLRMQIEEGFRDLKSGRYGFSLRQQGCRSIARIEILLLIAAFATYAILMCGVAATLRLQRFHYQANTERRRAVLSLAFLGHEAWKRESRLRQGRRWPPKSFRSASLLLVQLIANEARCALA